MIRRTVRVLEVTRRLTASDAGFTAHLRIGGTADVP